MGRWYRPVEGLKMATADNAELLALSGTRIPYAGKQELQRERDGQIRRGQTVRLRGSQRPVRNAEEIIRLLAALGLRLPVLPPITSNAGLVAGFRIWFSACAAAGNGNT